MFFYIRSSAKFIVHFETFWTKHIYNDIIAIVIKLNVKRKTCATKDNWDKYVVQLESLPLLSIYTVSAHSFSLQKISRVWYIAASIALDNVFQLQTMSCRLTSLSLSLSVCVKNLGINNLIFSPIIFQMNYNPYFEKSNWFESCNAIKKSNMKWRRYKKKSKIIPRTSDYS